ncbi:unnamed protein product [Pedinophyceae sp. YPF-701]|nr:unnamed protein product [Pedinophyceae sp. YPF-701]
MMFLVAVLLLFARCSAQGAGWTPRSYPDPIRHPEKCGREGVKSWICDPDRLISVVTADRVDEELDAIRLGIKPYIKDPCTNGELGFQTMVALMSSMDDSVRGYDLAGKAKNFARALHDNWGVGDRKCNDGILILLSIFDRQIYISTGKGAKGFLTDSEVQHVIATMRPLLRQNRLDDAVLAGVRAVGKAIAGDYRGQSNWAALLIPVLFFGTIGACICCAVKAENRRRQEFDRVGELLGRINQDREAAANNRYVSTSCPICLEDYAAPSAPPEQDEGSTGSGGASTARTSPTVRPAAARGGPEQEPLVPPGTQASAGPGGETLPPVSARGPEYGPFYLPCGHSFCGRCISQTLRTDPRCPICRQEFQPGAPPGDSPGHDGRPQAPPGGAPPRGPPPPPPPPPAGPDGPAPPGGGGGWFRGLFGDAGAGRRGWGAPRPRFGLGWGGRPRFGFGPGVGYNDCYVRPAPAPAPACSSLDVEPSASVAVFACRAAAWAACSSIRSVSRALEVSATSAGGTGRGGARWAGTAPGCSGAGRWGCRASWTTTRSG